MIYEIQNVLYKNSGDCTYIDPDFIRNPKISYGAKAFMGYIMSYPKGTEFDESEIDVDGTPIKIYVDELRALGFLK